jgi:hypothetical protein
VWADLYPTESEERGTTDGDQQFLCLRAKRDTGRNMLQRVPKTSVR